jgi:hypothetical protein
MFATADGTVDRVRERRREARRRELRSLCEQEARIKQRITQIVREADDDEDCRAAGCSSSAQRLAQVCSSDHRTAVRITSTSSALRSLPALDHALSTGALTLDQVAAAAEYATPGTDAELARIAVGKAPSAIALAARTIVPPTVDDDQALYERRALSMSWTRGRRELSFSGGKTELDNLILLCPRHHKLLHDHRIRASGHGEQPAFADEAGRAITTNQPHAPPR